MFESSLLENLLGLIGAPYRSCLEWNANKSIVSLSREIVNARHMLVGCFSCSANPNQFYDL